MNRCKSARTQKPHPVRPGLRLQSPSADTDFCTAIPSPHLTATPLEQETAGVSDTADNGHEVGTLVYRYVDSTPKQMILTLAASISSTHATNTSSTHATNM